MHLTTVKDRLVAFLGYKKIGQARFASTAGLSRGYVNNIVNTIGPEAQPKIATAYPDLNMTWLLTGDGEMLNGETGCEQENTNPTNMNYDKFFQTIERRDRQFEELLSQTSRLIAVIERMQGIHPTGDQITSPIRINNE